VNLVGKAEDLPSQIAASSEEFPNGVGAEVLLNRLDFWLLSVEFLIRISGLEWRQWHGKIAEGTLAAAHTDQVYDVRVQRVVIILI
jgi:hypothetical protein